MCFMARFSRFIFQPPLPTPSDTQETPLSWLETHISQSCFHKGKESWVAEQHGKVHLKNRTFPVHGSVWRESFLSSPWRSLSSKRLLIRQWAPHHLEVFKHLLDKGVCNWRCLNYLQNCECPDSIDFYGDQNIPSLFQCVFAEHLLQSLKLTSKEIATDERLLVQWGGGS